MTLLIRVRELWLSISSQPAMAAAIIGLAPLLICILMAIQNRPAPVIHDEHSNLLAADTFLHGRLANPTHPKWVFFENFHINQQPTYVSKYPPMQGFALAFGRLISGQAIVGVWLSLAAACVAVFWMLRAWLPPPWAFAGGLLTALNGDLLVTWGLSYWGGAMAMLGGALLYGAVPRLVNNPRIRDAILCGTGIAILAMSRPYEGLIASIPAAGYLLFGLFRNKELAWGRITSVVILPLCLILLLSASFMAFYNYRTTGNPYKFPYSVNAETYSVTPLFFFGDIRPSPGYRHYVMKRIYIDYAVGIWRSLQTFSGYMERKIEDFKISWLFFSPSLLTVFVLGIPAALKSGRFRFVVFSCMLFVLSQLLISTSWPHYAAPYTGLFTLVIISGLRALWNWEFRGKRFWPYIIIPIFIFSIVHSYKIGLESNGYRGYYKNSRRSGITSELEKKGGKHLIFVRYTMKHNIHDDWVWNGADIDSQQVVWARFMNVEANRELIDYYKDRKVWLFAPDFKPMAFRPYAG